MSVALGIQSNGGVTWIAKGVTAPPGDRLVTKLATATGTQQSCVGGQTPSERERAHGHCQSVLVMNPSPPPHSPQNSALFRATEFSECQKTKFSQASRGTNQAKESSSSHNFNSHSCFSFVSTSMACFMVSESETPSASMSGSFRFFALP